MSFTVNVGNASILTIVKLSYEKTLNGVSNFELAADGINASIRAEMDTESSVEIFRDGTSDFVGTVETRESYSGGGIIISGIGIESELTEQKCPMVGSLKTRTFTSNDHTILTTLLTSSGWTLDTSNSTQSNIDSFRCSKSQSIWNAIIELNKQTNKDIRVDQSNKKIYLYDALNRTDKFVYTEGINCGEISESKSKPKAAKVEVYGKGDGSSQVYGEAGSGTPVHEIIDRNIVTNTEATTRATQELALITNSIYYYSFQPNSPTHDIILGDSGDIVSPSAGINKTVDVVRIKRGISEVGTEYVTLEVTDQDNRVAKNNLAENIARIEAKRQVEQASMQGSGNQNIFGSGINAKTDYALKIGFYISPTAFQNEAGEMNISALNVSYDIDPFKITAGSASFDGLDPQVQNTSGDTEPGLSGTMDNQDDYGVVDVAESGAASFSTTISFVTKYTFNDISGSLTQINCVLVGDEDSLGFYVRVHDNDSGVDYPTSAGQYVQSWGDWSGLGGAANDYVPMAFTIMVPDKIDTHDLQVQVKGSTGSEEGNLWLFLQSMGNHKHGFASMTADDHSHPDGTYDINATDLDNISIDDDVDEAGSVNASSVNLYLDFWNGSAWVNKHSILDTTKTIDQGVDISDSGTYPDATGWWRVRVEPITATADYAQGIVEIINFMDN